MNNQDMTRYEEAARMLKVLGHPMRLAMVEALRNHPWCVCKLAADLGLNKSAASKHLSLLKSVGVVEMVREGTQVNCTLAMPCVFDMMRCARFFTDDVHQQSKTSCQCPQGEPERLIEKQKIMFVCIHNSARSQMCEAFVRHYAYDRFEVQSSGIEAGDLNPLVVKAMEEIGISMNGHYAKSARDFIERDQVFDYVITVCDETSAERCPMFPGTHKRLHWGFPDPSALSGSEDEKLVQIRVIRDAILRKIQHWLESEEHG